MSKFSIKILLIIVVLACSINITFATKGLDHYKNKERQLTIWIENIERLCIRAQKRIEYWEYQLTGLRRFFYPRELGLRGMVEGWISRDKAYLARYKKDLEFIKRERKKVQDIIIKLEMTTGLAGEWKPEDRRHTHIFEFVKKGEGRYEAILKKVGHLDKYNWKGGQQIIRNLEEEKTGDYKGEICYKYVRGGKYQGLKWWPVVIKVVSGQKIIIGKDSYIRIR